MKETGYGAGYVYAHDTEHGVGGLDCLPDALAGTRFYEPKGRGFEQELNRRLAHFRKLREEAKRRGSRRPRSDFIGGVVVDTSMPRL